MLKNKDNRGRKGQAAMEYLMTYGWALLVIVLVIAALIVINPFRAPKTCLFTQPGLYCEGEPQVYIDSSGNTFMNIRISNRLGQTITFNDKAILCTTSTGSDVKRSDAQKMSEINTNLQSSGGVYSLTPGQEATFQNIKCKKGSTQLKLANGQEFRGSLVLWYNYETDIDKNIKHQTTATVINSVVQQ